MHGAVLLALAAAASALPATLNKRVDSQLERRDDATESNLFVCPGNAPYGGCSLNGNPYYVNEAKTGTVVDDLLGIWECPTTYGLSNITALCCSDLSHDGDYDYSTWCDTPRTTSLSTSVLLGGANSPKATGPKPDTVKTDSALEQLLDELEDALKELDLEKAEAELEAATKDFDVSILESTLDELTKELSAEELEADLKKVTDAL
ncbi:hypothetical protein M409DRAFT_57429 [Zasmidium cellare ATCC 36951]|uniref:Uncharacterized protein n=1 Tax=Zasmidium cellare ATCC 36951 TaxID=1080233 RepID=A0A6A6CC98_ZASCE|nr:uncharacterized protein M409DRAFT_57429 [Zasmidium cellare ATCC 36951]KAF2163542.1 hypothetical protein M409DRAFT_57429 [Zasmidium cellare ATCC 36951]